jgi:hypothetical protein
MIMGHDLPSPTLPTLPCPGRACRLTDWGVIRARADAAQASCTAS